MGNLWLDRVSNCQEKNAGWTTFKNIQDYFDYSGFTFWAGDPDCNFFIVDTCTFTLVLTPEWKIDK